MTQPAKWYELKAAVRAAGEPTAAEVFIYGNIGDRWDENGVVAADLVRELSALDVEEITVRINSFGGSVTDGLAIYNGLRRHRAAIAVHIDGVAISIASLIAMAGDTITMAENAQMMIHAPWTIAIGNSKDMRDQADVLDRYARAMGSSYSSKSTLSPDECLALLTDGQDHWYSAKEALAVGFADVVGEPVAIAASLAGSFDLSRFQSKPAAPAAIVKEAVMPTPNPATVVAAPVAAPVAAAPAGAAPVAPVAPFARNREMNEAVVAQFKPFAHRPEIVALQTEVLSDPALTMEAIQAKLLVALGKDAGPANPAGAHPRVDLVEGEADKHRDAVVTSLLVRAGVERDPKVLAAMGTNPYRASTLRDHARIALDRAGVKTAGMSQLEIVAAAFTQSTSDFPVLLENTMHKTLQRAYALANLTWQRFCATGSVSDFRAHNRYRVGSFGSLDTVNELGEFTNKTVPDGEKATITATTKGNIINLSRQAIINDDLGAFVGLAASLGRAAARTIEADVYALLALNSGAGPTMGDSKALFHTDHGNISTSAALSMAAIDLDRVAMASQKDVSGNDYLDLRPAVLVVPIALGGSARAINEAQYDPDTANKMQKPNSVRGLFSDIVDTPRITGARRYLFADPQQAPTIEVAFLDGNQEPFLEVQNGFTVDGASWKVRIDYAVGAVDYRGAVTNAGG